MKTLLSIIVPVYNAEKWLRRCVDSLLNQDLPREDYEIILVDDGSTDDSPRICDEYLAAHPGLVRVIHQPNSGVSMARNTGIELAKGEYLSFVDSDDYVDRKFVMSLIKRAYEVAADIVICGYYENSENKCYSVSQNIPDIDNEQIIIGMFRGAFFGSMWNKIYKRDFVIRSDIKVIGHLCEDLYFNVQCLLKGASMTSVNDCLYYYNRNEESCRKPMNEKMGVYSVEINHYFCEMLKNHDNLFSAFVKYEMPWMAYLALYFNSCSAKEYENEFNYLLLENGFSNEKYVKLALRNYHIASFVMGFRKMMSKIKNI